MLKFKILLRKSAVFTSSALFVLFACNYNRLFSLKEIYFFVLYVAQLLKSTHSILN